MLAIAADITHAESHNNNMIKTMHKHDLQEVDSVACKVKYFSTSILMPL